MFLRSTNRKKDGKSHRYFSVVENQRVTGDKTVQRTVLYLGEINDSQQSAWRKTLEVFDEEKQETRRLRSPPFLADLTPKPELISCRQGGPCRYDRQFCRLIWRDWSYAARARSATAGWRVNFGGSWA
jgi:hypothetical protein